MSDDAPDGLLEAVEDWFLRRQLHQPPSIFPPPKATPSLGHALWSGLAVVIQEHLPADTIIKCAKGHPLNQTGRDEVWMTPAYWEAIKGYIDDNNEAEQIETVA